MTKTPMYSFFLLMFLLGADQVSKWFFYSQKVGASLPFLEPLFNTGISWGFPMPSLISCVIALLCSLIFFLLFTKKRLTLREFSLFMAGTLGNLLDRFFLGGVRDFIALGTFPVFNFADVFLTIAVILVCVREIFLLTPKEKKIN